MLQNVSASDLRRAAAIKERIDSLQAELDGLLRSTSEIPKSGSPRKRRRMSAAAKAKIAEAQKARWARWKAAKKK